MEHYKSDIFRIQKTIAIIASGIGFGVFAVNLIHSIELYGIEEAFLRKSVFVLFISSAIVLFTGFLNKNIARLIQLGLAIFTGAMAILDEYDSIFGIGIFLLSAMIAFRYGYFRRYLRLKAATSITITFVLIYISAHLKSSSTRVMMGLDSILYMSFFLMITYLIYSDEINRYIKRTKEAETTAVELIEQRKVLQQEMNELNMRIVEVNEQVKPVNLKSLGITVREEDVLRALITYREKEEDIAIRLGIGYQTVKTHFKHIRDKLGVDRREEIIDMCRNNFLEF